MAKQPSTDGGINTDPTAAQLNQSVSSHALSPAPGVANRQPGIANDYHRIPSQGAERLTSILLISTAQTKPTTFGRAGNWLRRSCLGLGQGLQGRAASVVGCTLGVSPHFGRVPLKSCEDALMQSLAETAQSQRPNAQHPCSLFLDTPLTRQVAPRLHLNALCPSFLLGTECCSA